MFFLPLIFNVYVLVCCVILHAPLHFKIVKIFYTFYEDCCTQLLIQFSFA